MITQRNSEQLKNNQIRYKTNQQELQSDQIKRQNSTTGKTLERICVDWINMRKTTPTYTTKMESKKHCDNYNAYIDTGRYKK